MIVIFPLANIITLYILYRNRERSSMILLLIILFFQAVLCLFVPYESMIAFSDAVRNRDFGLANIIGEEMLWEFLLVTTLTLGLHVGLFWHWSKGAHDYEDNY